MPVTDRFLDADPFFVEIKRDTIFKKEGGSIQGHAHAMIRVNGGHHKNGNTHIVTYMFPEVDVGDGWKNFNLQLDAIIAEYQMSPGQAASLNGIRSDQPVTPKKQ